MKEVVVYYCTDLTSNFNDLLFYPFGKKALSVMEVDKESGVLSCPAFRDSFKNTFCFQSPKDMVIRRDNNNLSWDFPEGVTTKDHFLLPSAIHQRTDKTFTIRHMNILFWCDEELEIEQVHPSFVYSDLAAKAELIQGKFDINKWFRPLDTAYQMRDSFDNITIKRGESLFFVKFKTERDVVFKNFYYSKDVEKLVDMCMGAKNVSPNFFKKIQNYYDLFVGKNMSKRVSKAVKEAVV